MADPTTYEGETLAHRLILPRDANHHGTLYAGVLLSISLEAAYATAFRAAGLNANLVLKRVLDLRCYEPVSVGRVVQIRGREIHRCGADCRRPVGHIARRFHAVDGRADAVRPGRCCRPPRAAR